MVHRCGDYSGFTSDKLSSQMNNPSCFYVYYTREEYRSKYITGAILYSQSYMWSLGGTTICNYAICMKLEVNNINKCHPAFHSECPGFFWRIWSWEKMRSVRSDRRQVELRRLGKKLSVLGKANSLCKIVKCCVFCLFVKGSFTIIDIYESVQRVLFLMTPSPKAYSKMLIFFQSHIY